MRPGHLTSRPRGTADGTRWAGGDRQPRRGRLRAARALLLFVRKTDAAILERIWIDLGVLENRRGVLNAFSDRLPLSSRCQLCDQTVHVVDSDLVDAAGPEDGEDATKRDPVKDLRSRRATRATD